MELYCSNIRMGYYKTPIKLAIPNLQHLEMFRLVKVEYCTIFVRTLFRNKNTILTENNWKRTVYTGKHTYLLFKKRFANSNQTMFSVKVLNLLQHSVMRDHS